MEIRSAMAPHHLVRQVARTAMAMVKGKFAGDGDPPCPFCAQSLNDFPRLRHYQAYFSDAYAGLKAAITQMGQGINAAHAGDVPAAFERAVRVPTESAAFWQTFVDVPEISADMAAIARDLNAAREVVHVILRSTAAAPLDATVLSPEALASIEAYHLQRNAVVALSDALMRSNAAIDLVKEQAAAANVATLQGDLTRLRAIQAHFAEPTATACQAYLDEKAAKAATEVLCGQARDALDKHRQNIFPAYEATINDYLHRFNAVFRLGGVGSVNTRAGSSCTYNVLINNIAVALTAAAGPSFRTTLSAGGRNTLAIAFFFASLDQDAQIAQKIVIVDDPMISLDEHRSLTTVQQMHQLQARVGQVGALSHSKSLLCALWKDCDVNERSAILIRRDGAGSTLAAWDVRQDCITEHDRRHELLRGYVQAANSATERQVASALRQILEAFMRVAYPASFPPGRLLGQFHGLCQQRLGTPEQILAQADGAELRVMLDYANRFHHDTNFAWEVEAINDQELLNNCSRVLTFAQRA